MAVKLHQIHGCDVQIRMLDRHGFIDLFQKQHAELRQNVDIFHRDVNTDLLGIHQGKKRTAKGNIIRDHAVALNVDRLVFLIEKGGNIQNADLLRFTVLYFDACADQPGRGIQHNVGVRLGNIDHAGFHQHGGGADTAVSAHVQTSARIHKDYAVVRFLMHRRCQQCAKHIAVTARLQHQRLAVVIVMADQIFLLLHHSLSRQLRKSIVYDACCFSHRVGIDRAKGMLIKILIIGTIHANPLLSVYHVSIRQFFVK